MTIVKTIAMNCNLPRQLASSFSVCAALILLGGCGWVDSAGPLSDEQSVRLENLSGNNDVVVITAEEQLRLDTSALSGRDPTPWNDQLQSRMSWKLIGNSDISACPQLRSRPDTGVSLQLACDNSVYGNSPADCNIHFLELPDNPGIFEVSAPAVTNPVVLRYEVTSTFSNGSATTSDLTICLEP